MSDIAGPYVNHADAAVDGAGNVYAIITQDGPQSGDTDVIVKKCPKGADMAVGANWKEAARFTERECGKHGYGSGVFVGTTFVAVLSERNAAGETVARVRVIEGLGEAGPDTPAMGGGYVAIPPLRVFAKANWSGEATVTLLELPPGATPNVKVTVSAPAAGRAVWAGDVNAIAQAAGVRNAASGFTLAEGGKLTIRTEGAGGVSEALIDLIGWMP